MSIEVQLHVQSDTHRQQTLNKKNKRRTNEQISKLDGQFLSLEISFLGRMFPTYLYFGGRQFGLLSCSPVAELIKPHWLR